MKKIIVLGVLGLTALVPLVSGSIVLAQPSENASHVAKCATQMSGQHIAECARMMDRGVSQCATMDITECAH